MYGKIIFNIFFIVFLVAVQLSFISGLPSGLNNLNLVLVALIFILAVSGLKFSVWWAIAAGLFMDMLSFLPFGTYLLSLVVIAFLIDFSLHGLFTNRSLYTFMALTALATFSYSVLIKLASYIMHFLSGSEFYLILNKAFWINELNQLVLNIVLTAVVFYFFNLLTVKLKPVFLIRTKK